MGRIARGKAFDEDSEVNCRSIFPNGDYEAVLVLGLVLGVEIVCVQYAPLWPFRVSVARGEVCRSIKLCQVMAPPTRRFGASREESSSTVLFQPTKVVVQSPGKLNIEIHTIKYDTVRQAKRTLRDICKFVKRKPTISSVNFSREASSIFFEQHQHSDAMIFTPPPWAPKFSSDSKSNGLLGDFIMQGRVQEAAHVSENEAKLIDSGTKDVMDRLRIAADVAALAAGLRAELQESQQLGAAGSLAVAILSENTVGADCFDSCCDGWTLQK